MALHTSLAVQPHLYMGDSTGRPLDYGMVYFGQPNKDPEFYPINIFYDEALTIAASQPVRTKGGFLNANGDMVEIYAAELNYSVKVLDNSGRKVFYNGDMSRANTDGSISTRLPYAGAITRSQSDKNSDFVSINDFGASSATGFDSTDAIVKANAAGIAYVPAGNYIATESMIKRSKLYGVGSINGQKVSYNFSVNATLIDYGAVGDGVTDDTDAVEKALRSGKNIDGGGLTYKMTRTINILTDMNISNCTFDFSQAIIGSGEVAIRGVASNETNRVLTSNAIISTGTVKVSDTAGILPGDVLVITSDRVWSDDTADVVKAGEIIVVKTVDGNTLNLLTALNDTYNLVDNVVIKRIGSIKKVRMWRVNMIGNGEEVLSYGCFFARCTDIKIEQCRIEQFGAANIAFDTCYDFTVSNSTLKDSYGSGLGYGVVCLSACRNYRIIGNMFQKGRTGWTQGGRSGVGRDIIIANNNFIGQYTAALGTKNSCDGITVTGNTCIGDSGADGLQDGIRVRGRNAVVVGNSVSNYSRYSIILALHGQSNPYTTKGGVISGNTVRSAQDIAIYVTNSTDGDASNISITGNTVDYKPNIASVSKGAIQVRSAMNTKNITITGNTISNCPFNPVDVRTEGAGTVANVSITNNTLERSPLAIAATRVPVVTSGVTNEVKAPNLTV